MWHASNLSLAKKELIVVAVPLVFGLVFIGYLYQFLERSKAETLIAWQAKERYSAIAQIGTSMFDTISVFWAYAAGNRTLACRQRLEECEKNARSRYETAMRLSQGDMQRTKAIQHMRALQLRAFQIIEMAKSQLDEGNEAETSILNLLSIRKELEATLSQFVHEQKDLLGKEPSPRDPTTILFASYDTVQSVLLLGILFSILTSVALSNYISRNITSRLNTAMDNAVRLTTQGPLNPLMKGKDEIAQLDQILHQVAEVLEESARKERAIIENAVDVICSLDAKNRFVSVSPAANAVWGFTPEELTGRTVFSFILEEDAEAVTEAVTVSMQQGKAVSFEARFCRQSGEVIHTLWSAHWSEPEKSLFCVSHDITARRLAEEAVRQSEARLKLVMESMPVALVVLGDSGNMELINRTTERMFKYRATDLIGKPITSLFSGAFQQLEYLLEKTHGHGVETDAVKWNGETFPIEISIDQFQTAEGAKRLAIILDRSERQEMETLKREFVAMVTHDLRTPLSSLRATLALLQVGAFGTLSDSGNVAIGRADNEVSRLITLINDLLDAEKLRSGRFELYLDLVRINEVVHDACNAVKPLADARQINIDVKETDLIATADGARLVQVLINLLSNAVKFSPPASTITVSTVDSPNDVEIRVSDQGRGIPPEFKEMVFEKFRQVESTDATRKGGTGLGLAICKAIIEEHHGEIGVESRLGEGSTFWFRLPKARIPSDNEAE